jgi:hypothetical protein
MKPSDSLNDFPATHIARNGILVRREGSRWTIAGRNRLVSLDEDTLRLSVESGGRRWIAEQPGASDLVLEEHGHRAELSLAGAGRREISPYETGARRGILVVLEGWTVPGIGTSPDPRLQLFLSLESGNEELVCEVVALQETLHVSRLSWPGSFTPESFDHTVVPFMQGMLLPRNWPDEVKLYDSHAYGRGLYMPWWGFLQGDAGAMVILESPDDGGCILSHAPGGPTRIDPVWHGSLGRLRYPRRLRIAFTEGGYVGLAKRYRRHVQVSGTFVSLEEKAARTPLAARLVGSPVVHTSILYHIQPESSYYQAAKPEANHQLVSFADRALELEALAALGVDRAYVHLDGWGFRGYDNLHPDILPPCPEAGGWEGMRLFADTCDRLGYVFAVHDQYRDYYRDAASYSDRHTIVDGHGQRPFDSTWYGGHQSILCPRLAPEHVARNHGEIHARGVKLRGAYLDVFAVVPPDECHSPEHPVTRGECLRYRARCFDVIRSHGGVVSSEEPADWAIPSLDLVHHGPHALRPNPGSGPALGIPIPLWSLVYHDALILPWHVSTERGGWGIPESDHGYLYGLLHAGVPYLSLKPSRQELSLVRTLCALHERLGKLEMTGHEALDEGRRRQRSSYADGTVVEVDFDKESFRVTPPLAGDRGKA